MTAPLNLSKRNSARIILARTFAGLLLFSMIVLTGCGALVDAPDATATPPSRTPRPTRTPTPQPTPTPKGTRGTLTIWHSWDDPEVPALVQIIQEFQALYPDVLFDVQYIPAAELKPLFEQAAHQRSAPALLLAPADWGNDLYSQGLIQDLSGQVSESLVSSLNPPAVSAAHIDGALIGLPYSIQGVVLYRNKKILIEPANTVEEMINFCRTATRGDIIGANLERSFFFSGGHLAGLGGQLMDENGAPAFDNDQGLAWINLLRRLELAGPLGAMKDRDLELFKERKTGLIIDGTWNRQALADAVGPANIAIDPWPMHENGALAGYVQSENIYLSTQTTGDSLEASLKFIETFLAPQSQAKLADIGRIPAAMGDDVVDPILNPILSEATKALAGGVPFPPSTDFSVYSMYLDIALKSIFEGHEDPALALETAANSIRAVQAGLAPPQQP